MSKVLIIGAGGVGGVVTHKCAQVPRVFTLVSTLFRSPTPVASFTAVAGDKSSTIVFPVPMDILGPLMESAKRAKLG